MYSEKSLKLTNSTGWSCYICWNIESITSNGATVKWRAYLDDKGDGTGYLRLYYLKVWLTNVTGTLSSVTTNWRKIQDGVTNSLGTWSSGDYYGKFDDYEYSENPSITNNGAILYEVGTHDSWNGGERYVRPLATIVDGTFTIKPNANGEINFNLNGDMNLVNTTGIDAVSKNHGLTQVAYTATFNANGGTTANPQTITKPYNEALGTLPTTTRSGYNFNGWYTDASGGTQISTTTKVTTDVTYYAQWTAITYEVAYNGNGATSGSMSNSSHIYDVAKALTANGFTKTGYTFNGWNTNANGTGTSYSDKASVNNLTTTSGATVTLYAQWKANTYSVVLNGNDATSTNHTTSVTATYDSAMPSITKPSRVYTVTYNANGGSCSTASATSTYTFEGYYTATSGGIQYYTSAGASAKNWDKTSDTTLYAQWTYKSVILPTPTRSGYKFLGWANSSDAALGTTGNYTPDSDITLYAIWEALATMFVKVDGAYKAGIPYVKVGDEWKRATAVYIKVDDQWKLSTR